MDGNFYDGRKKWYIFQNLEKSVAEMLTKVKTPSGSNESLFLTRCLKVITVKLNFPISIPYGGRSQIYISMIGQNRVTYEENDQE